MRWSVRTRILLGRRPWIVWALVGAGSLAAALAVNGEVADVRAERARWGETRRVLVATGPVAAGTPAAAAAVEPRTLPLAAIPHSAVDEIDGTATIARDLVEGEVLVPADIGGGDARFVLAPPGHVLVAIPRPDVVVPLAPGDSVDVTVVDADGQVSGTPAVVVALTEAVLTVAVAPGSAALVATAAADASAPPGIVLVSGR